jgi:hypothetical protein
MESLHTLSSNVILSVHRFSIVKLSKVTIKADELYSNFLTCYNTLHPLYCEWLEYVRMYEKDVWNNIKHLKNNFNFTLLILEQLKKEVKKQIIKLNRISLNIKKTELHGVTEYLQYAKDLHIEVYGTPLIEKEYTKKDLIEIIKKCEKDALLAKVNPKSKKVVPLFS